VINGTIGLNIEECEIHPQDEETVQSEFSHSKENLNQMAESIDNISLMNGLNGNDAKNKLSYEYMDNSNVIDNMMTKINISDYLGKSDNNNSESTDIKGNYIYIYYYYNYK